MGLVARSCRISVSSPNRAACGHAQATWLFDIGLAPVIAAPAAAAYFVSSQTYVVSQPDDLIGASYIDYDLRLPDPHVDPAALEAADGADLPVLQHAEHLGLSLERQFADLVEEQAAAHSRSPPTGCAEVADSCGSSSRSTAHIAVASGSQWT